MPLQAAHPTLPSSLANSSAPTTGTEQKPEVRVTPTADTKKPDTQSTSAEQKSATSLNRGNDSQTSLDTAIESLNRSMQAWSTQLKFELDSDRNRVTVRVIDTATGDVIKTIPAESIIKAANLISDQESASSDHLSTEA